MDKPTIPLQTNFSPIDCQKAFQQLQEKQALYAHYFSQASWNGAKICFFERSYESPAFLYIVLRAFGFDKIQQVIDGVKKVLEEKSINQVLIYTASFLQNAGNYKSFGDSKFVPECSDNDFVKFWQNTPYWSKNPQQFNEIWSKISELIFNFNKPYALINFSDKQGTTGYYSANCTSADAQKVKKVTISKGIMSENNRLVKVSDNEFIIKVASCQQKEELIQQDNLKIHIKYGEFNPFLSKVCQYLQLANKYSANQTQQKMIKQYIGHFKTGNMEQHKQSQRQWIKDKQPDIQTNIGFIQSYLDPLKIRAQFEGFVSIVNKTQSLILTKLVENAPTLLKYLPWGSNFEVEQFKKPDFTSLQILAFGSSGVPVGINIPNYDDIRQNLGFKNVNLGNAYGEPTAKSIQYCPQQEIEINLKYYKQSLFVIVALHELLGHGSGRLLNSKPTFQNPIDNSQINTFYGENETWHSVFGQIASTYEQCRADSVALYLSVFEDVQAILLPNLTPEQRWDVVYVGWFDLIVSGLRGLVYFDKDSNKWLQAHIGASYAIFRVLQEQGGIFEIKQTQRDGKQYLQVHMNKQSIKQKGKNAMGKFLKHLQVYKSSADVKKGTQFFNHYLQVDQTILKYKEIVEKNKRPRRISIQPQTFFVQGNSKPIYKKYQATSIGCIESFVAHYQQNTQDIILEWKKNNQQFRY